MSDCSGPNLAMYSSHADWQSHSALYPGRRNPLSKSDFCTARAADSTSFPTIIVVREATVGPLFGTMAVSGCMISMRSHAEPESFRGDLREDGVGALAHLGAAGEDTHAAFRT